MADTTQRRRFLQCPRCGAENLPTSKFCAQCGMNLRGEVQAPAATTMASKAGAVLPYSPGQRGPGRTAQLAVIFFAFVLLACLFLGYLFLSSGADRSPPRPTPTPPRTGMAPPGPQFWGEFAAVRWVAASEASCRGNPAGRSVGGGSDAS